jgi:hypothetical protein
MAKFRKILLEIFVLALLIATSAISWGQLTVRAQKAPCAGLTCNQPSDCGRNCFCNGPSHTCYDQ